MQTLEVLTKADLAQFKIYLLKEIEILLDKKMIVIPSSNNSDIKRIPGNVAHQFSNISGGTLQNLRITGKIWFKKFLGSYYYNFHDL
ncbi:hypothetical protein BCY89_05305 [Sphingobacterium siyangense]|uniref:Uncharacterized protein n=1 Tax=Sphingobacterium siyangense TaxID=459529 RepID=A0A420FW06_9SPHI|nr:DNA-binding protein [Sphingobacterium siyangense]RKF37069.1 hypothetical protein BCY89_05305 [Sphingobacterium siyangense]